MSAFNTPWFNSQNPNFFNTLNKSKTPHLIITGETEDFDESTIQKWTEEGFDVRYIPLLDGGQPFINRIHTAGDQFGVSEQYAIIAFESAASLILQAHTKPTSPRLTAIIAYYPTSLPSIHTRFPPQVQVLVHLAGPEISVTKVPEVLGIQGRKRQVRKRIDKGEGWGERVNLPGNFSVYTYGSSAEPGFAEEDLDEYDSVACGLAFSRSLEVLRRGFRMEKEGQEGVEGLRDRFTGLTVSAGKEGGAVGKAMDLAWEDAHVVFAPSLTGGFGAEDLREFYGEFFVWPEDADVRLLSRTIGADRVVDELAVGLTHSIEVPWLLPGVPPTGKRIEMIMVSIFHVRGGKLESEHVYWDQATVLLQAGLLDPKLIPSTMKKRDVKRLPVVGTESANAIRKGSCLGVNDLIADW